MAEAFTVFEKFGDVCAELEESDRKELIYAINMYGMFGEEVELPYMLKALFISLKEDIDNSKAMRARGSKGGRPKGKPRVSEIEKPEVCERDEPTVCESEEQEVSDITGKSESQTNPIQTNPNHTKPKKERARFTPPTVDEVRAYCEEKGYTDVDPVRFVAFYESVGWVVGKARKPMRSWQAAVTSTWHKPGKEEDDDEYARL